MQITLITSLELPTQDPTETIGKTGTLIEPPNQCPAPPTPPAIWVSNAYWLIVAFSLVLRVWLTRQRIPKNARYLGVERDSQNLDE